MKTYQYKYIVKQFMTTKLAPEKTLKETLYTEEGERKL